MSWLHSISLIIGIIIVSVFFIFGGVNAIGVTIIAILFRYLWRDIKRQSAKNITDHP